MTTPRTVYLAGPEVFLPDGLVVLKAKAAMCDAFGFEARMPGDRTTPAGATADLDTLSQEIYAANVATMRSVDFGVFDLTPFRGVSADVGTTFELGLMTGMGKPVFAYTNMVEDYITRVSLKQQLNAGGPNATWRDDHGWVIENFGNPDNLMLPEAVRANGAPMVRHPAALPDLFHDLEGFKACLQQAQAFFAARGG